MGHVLKLCTISFSKIKKHTTHDVVYRFILFVLQVLLNYTVCIFLNILIKGIRLHFFWKSGNSCSLIILIKVNSRYVNVFIYNNIMVIVFRHVKSEKISVTYIMKYNALLLWLTIFSSWWNFSQNNILNCTKSVNLLVCFHFCKFLI